MDDLEVDLDALFTAINKNNSLSEVRFLHQLVTSREIEDIENIPVESLCETLWISLLRCWSSSKEFTEKEVKIWETISWFLSLPTFTSTDEDIRYIGNTITKEFCTKCKSDNNICTIQWVGKMETFCQILFHCFCYSCCYCLTALTDCCY